MIKELLSYGRQSKTALRQYLWYRDDLEILEFSEWLEKVRSTYLSLKGAFSEIVIEYAPAPCDETEIVSERVFLNLLESERDSYENDYNSRT